MNFLFWTQTVIAVLSVFFFGVTQVFVKTYEQYENPVTETLT